MKSRKDKLRMWKWWELSHCYSPQKTFSKYSSHKQSLQQTGMKKQPLVWSGQIILHSGRERRPLLWLPPNDHSLEFSHHSCCPHIYREKKGRGENSHLRISYLHSKRKRKKKKKKKITPTHNLTHKMKKNQGWSITILTLHTPLQLA